MLYVDYKGSSHKELKDLPKLPKEILIKELPKYLDGIDLRNYLEALNYEYVINKVENKILEKLVEKYPSCLFYLNRVLPDLTQIDLYKINYDCIKYLKKPIPYLQFMYVKTRGVSNLQNIKDPDYEIQLYCVQRHQRCLFLIKNPSEELQLLALSLNKHVLKRFKRNKIYPTDEFYMKAIQNDPSIFEFIENPSKKVKSFYDSIK